MSSPSAEPAGPAGPSVVDDPAEIDPAWMSTALGVRVTSVRYEPIGTGQTGASYRFLLGGDGPASVVVKTAAGSEEVRAKVREGYRNEVGYYTTFADRSLIAAPRCWAAVISEDGHRFTLVLADAAPAVPGRQVDGCTVEQAAAAVRNLAGLHAPFWDRQELTARGRRWPTRLSERSLPFLQGVHEAAAAGFVEMFDGQLSAEDADTLLRTAAATTAWGRLLLHRASLIHGDYRLDNLMFGQDGPDVTVVAVDWQTLEVGLPGRDLAYFLSTALEPPLRRRHEQALVAAYHDRLTGHGVTGYTVEEAFADYRLGLLQGPLITTIGATHATGARTADSDRMFVSMASRGAAAIRDLGVLGEVAAQRIV